MSTFKGKPTESVCCRVIAEPSTVIAGAVQVRVVILNPTTGAVLNTAQRVIGAEEFTASCRRAEDVVNDYVKDMVNELGAAVTGSLIMDMGIRGAAEIADFARKPTGGYTAPTAPANPGYATGGKVKTDTDLAKKLAEDYLKAAGLDASNFQVTKVPFFGPRTSDDDVPKTGVRRETCPDCGGLGEIHLFTSMEVCERCQGSGEAQ